MLMAGDGLLASKWLHSRYALWRLAYPLGVGTRRSQWKLEHPWISFKRKRSIQTAAVAATCLCTSCILSARQLSPKWAIRAFLLTCSPQQIVFTQLVRVKIKNKHIISTPQVIHFLSIYSHNVSKSHKRPNDICDKRYGTSYSQAGSPNEIYSLFLYVLYITSLFIPFHPLPVTPVYNTWGFEESDFQGIVFFFFFNISPSAAGFLEILCKIP